MKKKHITVTVRASFDSEEERDFAGRLLAIALHEAKYQIEKRHPGNAITSRINGYTLEI